MALPGNKNFSDYDNYITDQNPTTSAQAQDYFRNQWELVKAVIDCDFWQPETTYQPGDVVKSDNMPNGTEAVMVATKANVTSNVEPQWGAVGGANVPDGACFWKLRWQHWSKDVASVDDMKNGTSNDKLVTPKLARLGQTATNRLPNTAYTVGNVVYVDSNLSVALKCTTAGTTSNAELGISGNNVGDTVADGSVVWQVVGRDLSTDVSNLQDDLKKEKEKVQTIELGGTGATTPKEALANLGGITSVSGINADTNGDANVFETQLGHTASGGSYLMVKNYASRVFQVFFYEPIYVSRASSNFTINLPFPLPNPCLAWSADLSTSFDGKTHLTGVSTTSYSGVLNIFSDGGAGLNATQILRGYFMGEL